MKQQRFEVEFVVKTNEKRGKQTTTPLSEELNFEKELKQLYLALCPVCAARYKIFVKGDDDAMRELLGGISDHDESDDECEFSIEIGLEESTVRFTLTHLVDIRTVFELGDD